jgi:predicted membrane protein
MSRKNMFKIPALIILIIGLTLLVFMVLVEDEPGALPLMLVLIGALGLIYSKFKSTL